MGNQSSSSSISFNVVANKNEARKLLNEAEERDFYLAECNDNRTNSTARKSCVYAPNYIFNDHGQEYNSRLQISISQLPPRLRSDLQQIHIIPLMYSADGGMPHTRPYNMICVPNITQLDSLDTLKHELWHVHQRNFQPQWAAIFGKLGWTEYNGQLPESFDNHRRLNPDTIDCPYWIYQHTWVPVPIFTDISKPVLNQVEIWFYNIKDKYHVKKIPDALAADFPNLPQSAYEHPRELTAYLLAEPDKYRHTPAWKIISGLMPGCE